MQTVLSNELLFVVIDSYLWLFIEAECIERRAESRANSHRSIVIESLSYQLWTISHELFAILCNYFHSERNFAIFSQFCHYF